MVKTENSGKRAMGCERTLLGGFIFAPLCYGLCIWIAENLLCVKKLNVGLLSELLSKRDVKALMHFNTECHHSINVRTVTWFIYKI